MWLCLLMYGWLAGWKIRVQSVVLRWGCRLACQKSQKAAKDVLSLAVNQAYFSEGYSLKNMWVWWACVS